MKRYFFMGFLLTAGLLILAMLTLSHAAWATPTQAPPAAQTENAPKTSHGPAASPEDGPTYHMVGVHHPRGDLGGSYSLNTPANPGFWIAASLTGLVGIAWLVTLVLFRPVQSR
jgi:hypothetical protein